MPRSSAFLATLLVASLALGACSDDPGGSGGPERADGSSGSADASGTATPTEPEDDGAEVAEPVMVGDFPHRPACRLFTPEDALELLPLTDEADFSGDAVTASVPAGSVQRGAVDESLATTSCLYSLGDADATTVRIGVKEYVDERSARSRWTTIRRFGEEELPPGLAGGGGDFAELDDALQAILEDAKASVGGVRMPGIDQRILWRIGSTEFMATDGNLLVTFDRGTSFGLTSSLTKRDAALAERVLVRALERAADPETPTTPVPALFEQGEGWPTFLDPCSLLDEEVAEALLGRPTVLASTRSVDIAPDVNLRADSAAGRSPENACDREAEERKGTAELYVQYAASQDTAEDVLESYVGNLAFSDPTPSREQVHQIRAAMRPLGLPDLDASYLLAISDERYRVYLLADRYLVELAGYLPKGKYGRRSVDGAALQEASELLAANLAAAVADGSTD